MTENAMPTRIRQSLKATGTQPENDAIYDGTNGITDVWGSVGSTPELFFEEEGDDVELPSRAIELEMSDSCETDRHMRCCGFFMPVVLESEGMMECECACHVLQCS